MKDMLQEISFIPRIKPCRTRSSDPIRTPKGQDLETRFGQGMEEAPAGKVVTAEVPLAEMFGYATSVRSMSQGRATFAMEFAKYLEVPNNVADAVLKKAS